MIFKSMTNIFLVFLAIVLIVLSYHFVDKNVVWFLVSHNSRTWPLLHFFANDIVNSLGILIFVFYIYFAMRLSMNKVSLFDTKIFSVCGSIVISFFIVYLLKMIFGRYWTTTFIHNNLSLVSHHVYGFNWFAQGDTCRSFPSGHATYILAFAVSMCLFFKKWSWIWGLLAALVILGQVVMYYHFVSDVLAGMLLGTLIALFNYRFMSTFYEV